MNSQFVALSFVALCFAANQICNNVRGCEAISAAQENVPQGVLHVPAFSAANRKRSVNPVLFFEDDVIGESVYEAALTQGGFTFLKFTSASAFEAELNGAQPYDIIISATQNELKSTEAGALAARITANPGLQVLFSYWSTNGVVDDLTAAGFQTTGRVNSGSLQGVPGELLDGITATTTNTNWGTFVVNTIGATTLAVNENMVPIVAQSGNHFFNGFLSDAFGTSTRKRGPNFDAGVEIVLRELNFASAAVGDPHLAGKFGIQLEVFGEPNASFALVVTPAFAINIQLADRGPEERFITHVAVLYRGTSVTINPRDLHVRKAELISHFEALGSKVVYDSEWRMTVHMCPLHSVTFTTHHTRSDHPLTYLNVEVELPGCHNVFGGLLGQTYQCKWANETFSWSRNMEALFRLPTLDAPSGTYVPNNSNTCATATDGGAPIRSVTTSDGTTTRIRRR